MTSIFNPEYKREFINEEVAENQICFTRSPLILSSFEWIHRIVPMLSPPHVGVNDEEIKSNNEKQLLQELSFAFHLKSEGYISMNINHNDPEALAEALCKSLALATTFNGKVLIEIPMVSNNSMISAFLNEVDTCSDDEDDQWKVWNKFHAATKYSNRIEVALILTSDLPSLEDIKRWLGENIAMLIIPHNCFQTNHSNYPILSRKHSIIIGLLVQYTKCRIVIQPRNIRNRNLARNYGEYVEHIIKQHVDTSVDNSFDDCLRYPLQPLYDNLDTSTYEVFEMDRAKYILYQKAIEAAMKDKVLESEKARKKLVLMVLGAGRGPLIRAALNASKNTQRKLKILVVEKNPNAIVSLTCLIDAMWAKEDITLIYKDMRKLNLTEKADIIVSELLGSFGDNELSPECLDGAQHLLKDDGISIPYNSTSYLRPIMTTRVMSQLQDAQNINSNGPRCSEIKFSNPREINWLVNFSSVYYIDDPKRLFHFVHPNHDQPIDNSRYGKLNFEAKIDCVLDGFAGYFTAQLYKDIEISILPETHTQGMASWFPIYFPVNRSYIKKGEQITVEVWRKVEPTKVWYEWKSQDGLILNEGGSSHPILM